MYITKKEEVYKLKKIKGLLLGLLVIVSAFALVACSSSPEAGKIEGNKDLVQGEEIGESYTRVAIKHELDEKEVKFESKPERIIVFDYGVLDAMDKIGEDIIGLPKKSVPPYLDKYKGEEYVDVGTLQEPNFETIFELQPDLIIISGRQASLYDDFKKIAPTVYLTIDGGDYMNSFKNNMKALGQIFNKETLLEEEVGNIENAISSLNEVASNNGKNGLFIMANDGNLSAYGQGSRFGILHKEFGVSPADENIESSTHGQKVTFEYILEKNPDYLFVMDRATIAGGDVSAKQVMDNDLIRSTNAYKNDNIIYLDAYTWYVSSGGITGTYNMVEEIQSAIK